MTFELLEIVPRDEPDDDDVPAPDLKRILVVCWRSSMMIDSSAVAGRARGQIKLCGEMQIKIVLI